MAPNLGFVAAPLLAEIFLLWFSWRVILLLFGLTSLLMGMANGRWGKSGNFAGEAPKFSAILMLVKQRSFLIMLIVFCAGIGNFLGIYTMLPLYLVTEQGMERGDGQCPSRNFRKFRFQAIVFAAGLATDRFGPKRALVWIFVLTGILTIALGFPRAYGRYFSPFNCSLP